MHKMIVIFIAAFFAGTAAAAPRRERSIELTETVRLGVPKEAGRLRLWIPEAPTDPFQKVELLEILSPIPHRATHDPDYENKLIFLELRSPKIESLEVKLRYRITRTEQAESASSQTSPLDRKARGLVVVNSKIRRIAARETTGLSDSYAKARALYEYVLKNMAYDKSGDGWGRGDSLYACKIGKGNCTDFHSLFIALCLAENIPARFRMGYPLPDAASGPVESAYHCWAEFHAAGRGWVPVDISEAWKDPERRDYYFGRLDADRVAVSTGREIRLAPRQEGKPLNFLSRPYAEADGKPVLDLILKRSYQDLGGRRT